MPPKKRTPTPIPVPSYEESRDSREDDTPEFITDDPTKPIVLIERSREKYASEPNYRDELNAMRDKYESDLAFRALYNMVRRQRRESNRSLSSIADSSMQVQHQASQDLAKISDLLQWKHETTAALRIGKWILGFLIAATLGSIATVVTKVYVWGETSGVLENRVQNLERQSGFREFKIPRMPSQNTPTDKENP